MSPKERNVVVGLLDASDDFIVHLLRQRLRVREVRLGVRVLSLEVRDDGRIFPIVVAEPEEVVVALDGGVHGFAPRFSPSTTPKRTSCGTRLAWKWVGRPGGCVGQREEVGTHGELMRFQTGGSWNAPRAGPGEMWRPRLRAPPLPRRMMARAATAAPIAMGATFTMFTIAACVPECSLYLSNSIPLL